MFSLPIPIPASHFYKVNCIYNSPFFLFRMFFLFVPTKSNEYEQEKKNESFTKKSITTSNSNNNHYNDDNNKENKNKTFKK